jgi:hypothetical protein
MQQVVERIPHPPNPSVPRATYTVTVGTTKCSLKFVTIHLTLFRNWIPQLDFAIFLLSQLGSHVFVHWPFILGVWVRTLSHTTIYLFISLFAMSFLANQPCIVEKPFLKII